MCEFIFNRDGNILPVFQNFWAYIAFAGQKNRIIWLHLSMLHCPAKYNHISAFVIFGETWEKYKAFHIIHCQ